LELLSPSPPQSPCDIPGQDGEYFLVFFFFFKPTPWSGPPTFSTPLQVPYRPSPPTSGMGSLIHSIPPVISPIFRLRLVGKFRLLGGYHRFFSPPTKPTTICPLLFGLLRTVSTTMFVNSATPLYCQNFIFFFLGYWIFLDDTIP